MNLRATVLTTAWVLLATAAVYASPVGDCPPVDPVDHTDHLPDDKNCTLFYKCDHAAPVQFVCPDGLHFNRDLEVCDWPHRAGCAGGSGASSTVASTASTTTTNTPPTSTATSSTPSADCPAVGVCPQDEDENSIAKHLAHASNCSQFCKCDHGKPVTFDCPAGLHFNPVLEVCDWPYRSGCAGGPPSTPTTAAPSSSTAASTSAATTPSTTAKPTAAPSGDCPAVGSCPQHEDENSIAKHLPHASNCSQFCKCDHGKPVTFDCPAGLHFNPVLEVCDWPYRSGCAGGPPSTPTTAAPSSSTAASTSAATTPSSTAKPTSAPSGDCPAVGSCPQHEDENSIAKHLPHASNCSQFCKCDHGKPVTFDCPAGLHFNPALEVCDWPKRAGCPGGSPSTPSTAVPSSSPTSAKPTTAAPINSTESSGDQEPCDAVGSCPVYDQNSIVKHLAHRSNCGLYCRCNHGVPITEKCPDGLHFNAKLEVCDWPSDAGCK